MEHGFREEHFDLLRRWGGHHYDRSDPVRAAAKAILKEAYVATEQWARLLKLQRYPDGIVQVRKSTINQGQVFSRYTWAKIYPSDQSPVELALTVGIDADGFMVKLDTVADPPCRARYLELRGDTNLGAPFAEFLPFDEGLAMSLGELVEWSDQAIDRFAIGYDALSALLGLSPAPLALVRDPQTSRAAFARWRGALLAAAIPKGSMYWLPQTRTVLRPTRTGHEIDVAGMDLGIDPGGRHWAVQINEPRIPGDHNSLSAIAIDSAGHQFLLRQGFLRPSPPGAPTISGDDFVRRTGLVPVAVKAEGLAARRSWFTVCRLDGIDDEIVAETCAFVDRCADARASAAAGEPPSLPWQDELFAEGERGGHYRVRRSPAEERLVLRGHGIVWLALAERLSGTNARLRKGRHRLGFEVDAEIDGDGIEPLLIEIKMGALAGDLHTAVGQLHLYARLFPRLAGHRKVLLLPRLPHQDVCSAAADCGIDVHCFTFAGGDPEKVEFEPDFLERCGVAVQGSAGKSARR